MRDLVLVAVNAKYIHTNLAIRSLSKALPKCNHILLEFSINDHLHRVVDRLIEDPGKIYGFSCYIWNIEFILKLTEILKKIVPKSKILLGGPEVSFDPEDLLKKNPWIDGIITGEGEEPLNKVMRASLRNETSQNFNEIPGVYFRNEAGEVLGNPGEKNLSLNDLDFPYSKEELMDLKDRIIYYETTRGCPYQCSYCLSSAKKGVDVLDLEKVLSQMDLFIEIGVKQVKLVDRTFNFNLKRAKAIFRHIIKAKGNTNFHFEMTGDLIDDEMIEILKEAPLGNIQFEIGIQSTDTETLGAIGRKIEFTKIKENVEKLMGLGRVHVHLDLIAGLPYETYEIFKASFNDTFLLKPEMLQLGFLKCLKGTRIRREGDIHSYQYQSFPPYEIISNHYISGKELYQLRAIETLVDRYYNAGIFKKSLDALLSKHYYSDAFAFFEDFSNFWKEKGYFDVGISKDTLFEIFSDFIIKFDDDKFLLECLKYDYITQVKFSLPRFFRESMPMKEWIFDFLKEEENIGKYLPELREIPSKKIFPKVKFQTFYKKSLVEMGIELPKEILNQSFEIVTVIFYLGKPRFIKF